jgi:pimeloyl-ACP methyl ester carboxylesterase
LDHLNVPKAALAGISIGGTIALVLAARGHPRVASVIAINPYDYAPAGGIRKSSFVARLILGPAAVPVLGTTLMRLRNPWVSNRIMRGGVVASAAIPVALAHELYAVGNRPGHYAGFLNLLEHEREWKRARDEYSSIKTPTLLIYGARDWAPLSERHAEQALLPQATARTIPEAGHFLSLDRPVELVSAIVEFLKPQASGAVSGAGAGT